jgi:hypothetical protein
MAQQNVDRLSLTSLSLELYAKGAEIGVASGFIVRQNTSYYLITNWHIVTNRHPETGALFFNTSPQIPDEVGIWYHDAHQLGTWKLKKERLLDPQNGKPLWKEHADGKQVDVVALPITAQSDVAIYDLDMALADTELVIRPFDSVSIIGFPYGISGSGQYPLWRTGTISSDVNQNYSNKPVFIVDAPPTDSMSGSPVFIRKKGIVKSSKGLSIGTGEVTRFLGIHAGTVYAEGRISVVWRPDIITEILSK